MVRYPQLDTGVPAGAIEDEDNLLLGASANLTRELGQLNLKDRNAHRRGQMKEGTPRGRMDKADEIAPGKAVLDHGGWTLANRRPNLAQQRLQADTVFVGGPEFNGGVREGVSDGPYERAELFLNAACCSASAKAWRGRGAWRLCLSRCR